MTAFWNRSGFTAFAFLLGVSVACAQPPKGEEKKKDEPPTKEELELRKGSLDLAYKFTPGEQIVCEAHQKRSENRTVQGSKRMDTRELRVDLVLSVAKALPKGGAEINARVARVRYSRISSLGVQKFDSNNAKNPDESSDGWELYGAPDFKAKFSFNVDPRGLVSDIHPDSETIAYWKQQPRELKALIRKTLSF